MILRRARSVSNDLTGPNKNQYIFEHMTVAALSLGVQPFNSQDFISNSPYCLPYNLCDVILENLVLNRPIIP